MDIASSAERLSKLTVSGDRTKPVPSDSARERTAELATAVALAKSTLDDPYLNKLLQAVGRRLLIRLCYKSVNCVQLFCILEKHRLDVPRSLQS